MEFTQKIAEKVRAQFRRLETLRLGPAVVCALGVSGPAPDAAQVSGP
jgi:hypothetical protein